MTAIGWIFIALGAYGVVSTLFGIVMNNALMHAASMERLLSEIKGNSFGARYMQFVLGGHPLFQAFSFLVSAAGLVAAIGLLKRRNWARLLFIGYLIFAICGMIVMVIVGFSLASNIQSPAGPTYQSQFTFFMLIAMVFGSVIILAFLILYLWIIKKLTSTAIRAEFV